MTLYGKWRRDAGTFVLVTAEGAAALAVLVVAVVAALLVVLVSSLGAPWWSLVVASGVPVGAGARLVKEAPTLARQYVGWRSGVIGRWETTYDAKRRTEEEVGVSGADGERRPGREGPKGPSGPADSRQIPGLNRTGTKDSEDRKRLLGRFVGRPEAVRFRENVRVTDSCHLWTGRMTEDGYPLFKVKVNGEWVWVRAHRWAWEQEHGPLSPGETLDHVRERGCHHHHCVLLDHLEAVSRAENSRRAAAWRREQEQARTAEDTPRDNGRGRPA